jgi:hypothetical protein
VQEWVAGPAPGAERPLDEVGWTRRGRERGQRPSRVGNPLHDRALRRHHARLRSRGQRPSGPQSLLRSESGHRGHVDDAWHVCGVIRGDTAMRTSAHIDRR